VRDRLGEEAAARAKSAAEAQLRGSPRAAACRAGYFDFDIYALADQALALARDWGAERVAPVTPPSNSAPSPGLESPRWKSTAPKSIACCRSRRLSPAPAPKARPNPTRALASPTPRAKRARCLRPAPVLQKRHG
jgi:hypothetical protein